MPRVTASDDSVVGKVTVESDSGELLRAWAGNECYLSNEGDLGLCLVVKNSKHKRGQGTFFSFKNIKKIYNDRVHEGRMSVVAHHMKRNCTIHITAGQEHIPHLEKLSETMASRALWDSVARDVSRKDGKRSREEQLAARREVSADEVEASYANNGLNEPQPQISHEAAHHLLYPLSLQQREVLRAVKEGKNVFISGSAGTGKSYLLRAIIAALPNNESVVVTASTGIAAVEIRGQTLHSFSGLGIGTGLTPEAAVRRVLARPTTSQAWRRVKTLIVDEVSMVHCEFFQLLDDVARGVRRRPNEPFGGIQLVLAGDFFQLPPIHREAATLSGHNDKLFSFESEAWKSAHLITYNLQQVFRQDNDELVAALNDLRYGSVTERAMEVFKPCIGRKRESLATDGILPTSLRARVRDVDSVNMAELGKLKGDVHTFTCADTANTEYHLAMLARDTNLPQELRLRIGAQVVLLAQHPDYNSLVNGSRGVVVGFTASDGIPVVRFATGGDVEVPPQVQELFAQGHVVATRRQIPLQLGWALSIHKSQGMSIDRLDVTIDQSVFEFGQAYVALSRCVTLEGLCISTFDPHAIKAHPTVLEFYGITAVDDNVKKQRPKQDVPSSPPRSAVVAATPVVGSAPPTPSPSSRRTPLVASPVRDGKAVVMIGGGDGDSGPAAASGTQLLSGVSDVESSASARTFFANPTKQQWHKFIGVVRCCCVDFR
eukprot:PhM_4_TR14284/c0_g2_i1/m.86281/K15255/PIF1; ATP-dependent DNA helicase PIF1